MKLLTKELIKKLPSLYATEEDENPVVRVKLFHPLSSYTVYLIEYNPKIKIGFGLTTGLEKELGYFNLDELENINIMGFKMEVDLYFKETYLSNIMSDL